MYVTCYGYKIKVYNPGQICSLLSRHTALENLNVDEDINRAWENIKENIKSSAKESIGLQELKQHKPWFDKECEDFLDQRKSGYRIQAEAM